MAELWIQRPSICGSWSRPPFNDRKPVDLTTVDGMLWQNFSSELKKYAPNINSGMRCYFILFTILFATWLFLEIGGPELNLYDTFEYSNYIFIPMGVLFFLGYFWIITRNLTLDGEIERVCKSYTSQFNSKGFSITYDQKYTGYCESKYVAPSRVIRFHAIAGFQESQQPDQFRDDEGEEDEEDPIKKWGL